MTISEIVSFLISKGFGKRKKGDRLSLSHIPFLIWLWFFLCDMCVLSIVVDYRIKVNLDLFVLQELGRAFKKNPFIEKVSWFDEPKSDVRT